MASITKRSTESGKRWDVSWRVEGREKSRTFKRLKDATTFRKQLDAAELVGIVVNPSSGNATVRLYAEQWIKTRLVKGLPLAPMTRYGYEGLLRRNIVPIMGDLRLRQVTPESVRTWHAELTTKSGQDAAAKSYRMLRAILNTAVDDELISRNPCRIKGAGSEHAPERPMLGIGDVLTLIEAMVPRYQIVLILAGLGGLRTGESLGLRREDIDPLRHAVHIRKESQEVPGHGRIVKDPKSEAGRRTVVLPNQALTALVTHLEQFGCASTGELVTGPKGKAARRASVSQAWIDAKTAVGADLDLHIHDLRHHAATMTARMPGITTKELMARIGHSSPRAALIYQHASEERDTAIATFLDAELAAVKLTRESNVLPFRGIDAG
jgi:integrase